MHHPISTQKMSHSIEGSAMIGHEDAGIGGSMYNQKKDKKNTGKSHHQLFADSRSKVLSPRHIKKLNNLMVKVLMKGKLTAE